MSSSAHVKALLGRANKYWEGLEMGPTRDGRGDLLAARLLKQIRSYLGAGRARATDARGCSIEPPSIWEGPGDGAYRDGRGDLLATRLLEQLYAQVRGQVVKKSVARVQGSPPRKKSQAQIKRELTRYSRRRRPGVLLSVLPIDSSSPRASCA